MPELPAPADDGFDYGFHGRLSAVFPSQLNVDITEVCNLACIHCPHPSFKVSEHYGARYLPLELNAKLVDEVASDGRGACQYIRYTSNGEPLVHPHAYDMLQDAVDRSGVYVTLTTNGTIMNEKRTRKLLASGLHLVDISIDAFTPETYAKVRVGGDLEVTRGNVLRLLRWVREEGRRTKVVVSFVEQPENTAETADFKAWWEDQGVDFVVIRKLHSAAGAVIPVAALKRGAVAQSARRPCLYPWERLLLNAKGWLAFCPTDWVHGSDLADFRQHSIREVWQSPAMQALRAAHLNNDLAAHGFCGQCPDWAQTTWPGREGRSYADMVADFRGQACE